MAYHWKNLIRNEIYVTEMFPGRRVLVSMLVLMAHKQYK